MPTVSHIRTNQQSTTSTSSSSRFAAGGRSAASSSKTVTFADQKKKKELTGKELADKIKENEYLAHLAEHLESLPLQISTIIEKNSTSMLNLYSEISVKLTPLSRFDTKIKLKDGTEVLFAPSCCRLENPVTGSRLIKDSDEFKQIVSDYDELIKKFRSDSTNLMKKVAELEVSTRQAKLRECVIASIVDVAQNLVVAEWTRVKCDTPAAKLDLSTKAMAYKIAHDYIHAHFNEIRLNLLKFDSLPDAEEALQKFRDKQGVTIGAVPDEFNDETKWTYMKAKDKLIDLFPKMSFEVFSKVSERNVLRSIDAELSVMNNNAAASELNEATADAITADAPITKSTLGEFVIKQLDKFKKEMRSNFSAD